MSFAPAKSQVKNWLPEGYRFVVGYEDGSEVSVLTKKNIRNKALFHQAKIPTLNESKSVATYLALLQVESGKKLILKHGNIKCDRCDTNATCNHLIFQFPNTLVKMLDGATMETLNQLNTDTISK